jgi:histidine ammonia-lyase/tyrosine ammonia-lyase
LQQAEEAFGRALADNAPVYGINTGFGPFVAFKQLSVPPEEQARRSASAGESISERRARNLLAHLSAGYGAAIDLPVVRAAMILRLQTLVLGCSGVTFSTAESYKRLLNWCSAHDAAPLVPSIGSLGASGDLTPLAHVARVLTGEHTVLQATGTTLTALEVLQQAGVSPRRLTARDALGLVNGTSFATAFAAVAVARAERLIMAAEILTGWLYRSLGCRTQALAQALHDAKRHQGQRDSAALIRAEALRCGHCEDSTRPLQEVYSLRTAPQILGACRDSLRFAREAVEREIASVDDNPVLVSPTAQPMVSSATTVAHEAAEWCVLHGGNFQTQHIGFAADALNAALTQAGNLVERQLDALMNPRLNGGAPLLLAFESGINSGFAGAQLTATAIVAEMRSRCQHYAVGTLPTNGGNQDIVPLGTQAARNAFEQTERLAALLAILALALQQWNALCQQGRVGEQRLRDRTTTYTLPHLATHLQQWLEQWQPLTEDRPLMHDIHTGAQHFLSVP